MENNKKWKSRVPMKRLNNYLICMKVPWKTEEKGEEKSLKNTTKKNKQRQHVCDFINSCMYFMYETY